MSATPHGVLVVDKPQGPTSHDIVAQARRLLRTKAVGHAGTLDPMATGVLVLLFGEATKLSNYLMGCDKRYRTTVRFGRTTSTLDAEGETTERVDLAQGWLTRERLHQAVQAEAQRTLQIPPQISAIKIDGERAYKRERRGESPILAPRPVDVRELELLDFSEDCADFELLVAAGYYVRAFGRDLGASLGVPSHLDKLRRLASGPFRVDEALEWPPADPTQLPFWSLESAARAALPEARLRAESCTKARQGKALGPHDFVLLAPTDAACAWYDGDGDELIAIGRRVQEDTYRVLRGFNPRAAG